MCNTPLRRIRSINQQENELYNKDILFKGELEQFRYLINDVYPKGIVSIVSDTFNLWRVLTEILPALKNDILNRDGKLVIRPDSGNPVKIVCGDDSWPQRLSDQPQAKGVVQLLWEVFGGTTNSKGYKELDSHIGCIYGDGINIDRFTAILEKLKNNGFASTNFTAGVGSYTYQGVTRDTYGLAFKATAIQRSGKWYSIYKDPITDDGVKRSAKGLLMVWPEFVCNKELGYATAGEYKLFENVTPEQEMTGCLQTVYLNGKITRSTNLQEIRQRLKNWR